MRMWFWKCNEMLPDPATWIRNMNLMTNGHVTHASEPSKDNVTITEKNATTEENEFYKCPYNNARILRQFITTKRRWFIPQYQHHSFMVEELGNTSRIHTFNRF